MELKTKLKQLIARRGAPAKEAAPQLTLWERRALAQPGPPAGGLPFATYDAMQTDGMVQTALTIKRLAVLAAPYRIEPADESAKAREVAAFVEENLADMDGSPLTILSAAMDAFAKGWSVQEILWRKEGKRLALAGTRPKDPAFFGVDVDEFGRATGLRLAVPGEKEVPLPIARFAVYVNRRAYAKPKGRSDLDAAHHHWQAKQTLLAAWKVHLHRFAMPTMMGRFERGMPADEVASLVRGLETLPESTVIAFPNEIEVSSIGGDKESSRGFLEAIEFHNREIARAILGQTLTTDEGRRIGSLALGKVHLQVLMLQVNALRRELADTVMTEQIIRPLVELNFGGIHVPRFLFDQPDLGVFATGALR